MLPASLDATSIAVVLLGAFVAGFTTGFAGFGTGLVASGIWFQAMPAPLVPPLVALASLAAHVVGLLTVRKAFDWLRAAPYLIGGVIGVPIGVAALSAASPELLRASVGGFLLAYALYRLNPGGKRRIPRWGGRTADGAVGLSGGFLAGFAALSGPPPLIWLQLRGGTTDEQRAVYQPFNMAMLVLASVGMGFGGQITLDVLWLVGLCLPITLFGAWIGARIYVGASTVLFERVVLYLLLASGLSLIAQTALDW